MTRLTAAERAARAAAATAAAKANPFDQAILADQTEVAQRLSSILESLKEFPETSIVGILYQKPANGVGAFRWIEECAPPFEFGNIFAELKERFGGGEFELRIRAGGKIRGILPINIAKERERPAPAAAPAAGMGGMGEIFAMMMANQQSAADRQMDMMIEMNRSQAATMGPVLAALAGGGKRESMADMVALVSAMQAGKSGGGIKETLEILTVAKTLMGPAESEATPGFDPDNLIESGARLIGPIGRALGDYMTRMRGGEGGEGPASSASGAEPQGGAGQLALEAGPSRFRIIELVRGDVTYGFMRGHDPEKIADLVYDIILANNVTQAEIDELAATFALSPTGLDDLAAEGIDLRARPQWAGEFFGALAAIHSEETADLRGGEGGAPDARANGGARPAGNARPKGPKSGGAADDSRVP